MKHTSIFKTEAIESLDIKPEGIYVDATLGRGGHSLEIAKRLTTGHLVCFDLDREAIEESKIILKDYLDKITFIQKNYANLEKELNQLGQPSVDGILYDLGVSSPQFDDPQRGFSYRFDSRLDMRMDQQQSLSAYEVVNEYEMGDLIRIFKEYGEERFAKSIARKIVNHRPIETTGELVDVIRLALPAKVVHAKGHPAKKVFQAIRIEVNQELESLKSSIQQAINLINREGRIVVITFHSLEDRIVKQAFNKVSKPKKVDKRLPQLEGEEIDFEHLTSNVVVPSLEEQEDNPRSQSAKLRVLRRKGENL